MSIERRWFHLLAAIVPLGLIWAGCSSSDSSTPKSSTSSTTDAATTGPTTVTTGSTGGSGQGGQGTGGMTSGPGGMGGNSTSSTGGGGMGGSTASSTGTGGAPPLNDMCANAIVLSPVVGTPLITSGSTVGAASDYPIFCASNMNAPDLVYKVVVPSPGTITITMNDGLPGKVAFDGAWSFPEDPCGAMNAAHCENAPGVGAPETFSLATAAGTYWLIVGGGANAAAGDFKLTIDLEKAKCGDGVVNPGEQCDVGANQNDPNCYGSNDAANGCKLKPPPNVALEMCPGLGVPIDLNKPIDVGPFDTTTYSDSYSGTCNGANPGGRDNVFDFKPSASGTLTITSGLDPMMNHMPYCNEGTCWSTFMCPPGCWQSVLYARSGCGNQATELACDFDVNEVNFWVAKISFPVTIGGDYFVFIDALNNDSMGFAAGSYYLNATLTQP